MPLALLLFAACAPSTAPESTDTGSGPLTLATIRGSVTRSVDVQEDGVGNLFVGLFQDASGDPLPVPLWGWSRLDVDLSAPGATIDYELSNVFPQEQPYYVAAIFDDDQDLVVGPDLLPSEGDLLSGDVAGAPIPPVYVRSGGEVTLDLVLDTVSDRDWEPGDGGGDDGGSGTGGGTGGAGGDGAIVGTLSRTAPLTGDGIGTVHAVFFAEDPRSGGQPPAVYVGRLPDIDLSTSGARVAYELTGFPTSATRLHGVIWMDDDDSGSNGPSAGDPIAIGEAGTVRVTVPDDTPVSLDVVLDAASC